MQRKMTLSHTIISYFFLEATGNILMHRDCIMHCHTCYDLWLPPLVKIMKLFEASQL